MATRDFHSDHTRCSYGPPSIDTSATAFSQRCLVVAVKISYCTDHIQALCDTDELNNFKVFGRIQVVNLFIYQTRNDVTVHKITQRMKKTSPNY